MYSKKHPLFLFLLLSLFSCKEKQLSEEEIKEDIRLTNAQLWDAFSRADADDFLEFYHEDVIRMSTDGSYVKGKSQFKESVYKTYETHTTTLESYSEPEILVGQDQVVTFNDYKEHFIELETRDTASTTEATWMAVWKKQEEGKWKIVMTTWHLK